MIIKFTKSLSAKTIKLIIKGIIKNINFIKVITETKKNFISSGIKNIKANPFAFFPLS